MLVKVSKSGNPKNCGKCGKFVKDNTKAVCCEFCSVWFHTKCEGISDEIYNFLNEGGEQIHWFCKKCNDMAIDVMKLVQSLKEKNDLLEKKIDELSQQVEDLSSLKDNFAGKVRDIVREEVKEIKDKEERACNVVISSIPESVASDSQGDEERRSDLEKVNYLIHEVLQAPDVKVVTTHRVPKLRDGNASFNRKTVVKLEAPNQRNKLLRIAKNLRGKEEWQGVYINPDLTVKERKKDYELRKELKHRRENGEHNLVLVGGKIVVSNRRQANASSFLLRSHSHVGSQNMQQQ
ncbi:Histone-lysine N-methyltransferase trithorax [Holothuria leucospilota]|uniref:Histone-lysine N-methyltransferase trithorax n=1 Tax=Holothuria leucospilota TaxID=206669 RepID=A0A9Q1CDD3_HOLLE|nr:Histone-lysine N-methyltransferase trithorax [Holothuria leucospilota]